MFIPKRVQLDGDFAALDAVDVSAAVAAVLLAPRAATAEHRLVLAPAEDPFSVVDGVLPVAVLLDGKQGKAVIGGLAAPHPMGVAIAVCELARAALPAQGRRVAVQVLPEVAQGLLARQEDVTRQRAAVYPMSGGTVVTFVARPGPT